MGFSNTNKTLKSTCVLFCLILLFSCNRNATYSNRAEDKDDAQKITNVFYSLLRNEKYNDTYKLFSKVFFEVTDTLKLNEMYQMTYRKSGAIDSINLDHWQTEVKKGTNASLVYVLFFVVKREKYNSKETITLLKENDSIRIVGYHVDSDAFLFDSTK
jgi:hypothetical protein